MIVFSASICPCPFSLMVVTCTLEYAAIPLLMWMMIVSTFRAIISGTEVFKTIDFRTSKLFSGRMPCIVPLLVYFCNPTAGATVL